MRVVLPIDEAKENCLEMYGWLNLIRNQFVDYLGKFLFIRESYWYIKSYCIMAEYT